MLSKGHVLVVGWRDHVEVGGVCVLWSHCRRSVSNMCLWRTFWSCLVVIAMALYRVSLSFVLVVSCWSSGSRMICGRGVGAGFVSGVCRSGMG